MLILNDGEARQLTKETSLIKAAKKIRDPARALWDGRARAPFFGEHGGFSAARRIRSKTSTTRWATLAGGLAGS
jgi:hypothetical protein